MTLELFKNMILEAENLTDNLDDAQADRLLNWGIEHLPKILFSADAENNVSSLMRAMRIMNRIIGSLQNASVENFRTLFAQYSLAIGSPQALSDEEYETTRAALADMSAEDALTYLFNWLIL